MTDTSIKITFRRDNGSVEGEALFNKGKWFYFRCVGKPGKTRLIPAEMPPRIRKQLGV